MSWISKTVDQYLNLKSQIDELFLVAPNGAELVALQKQIAQLEDKYLIAKDGERVQNSLFMLRDFIEQASGEEKEFAIEEYEAEKAKLDDLEKKFFYKPVQESKIILEIRPGAGGKEACLFVDLLAEMYERYCVEQKWSWEVFSLEHNSIGGIESIIVGIEGLGVFENMEYESGVHRIQRVPITESCGRIHTSTATVAVLFEPEEVDADIDEQYLKIDVFRAGGAGGQHVNKTESAVRLTYAHPDMEKIVVSIQDEKSQHKNKSKAMKLLRAKIAQGLKDKVHNEQASKRKTQVGNADRSEKIRTYNFPQNRVTDHRVGVTIHSIQKQGLLLPKDLSTIMAALIKAKEL